MTAQKILLAHQGAAEGLEHVGFLTRLVELELIDRERRMLVHRIKAAKFDDLLFEQRVVRD